MKGFCEDDFMNFHEMKKVHGRSPNFLLWRHYYRLVVMVHAVIGNPSLSVCQKSGKGVLYSIPFDNYFIVFSLTYQRCFGSCFSLYHFINNLLHQLCIIGVFVEFYWNVRETIFSFQHWSDFYYLSSQEMTCAYEKPKTNSIQMRNINWLSSQEIFKFLTHKVCMHITWYCFISYLFLGGTYM